MSNLGLHSIYASLNALDSVRCERAFLPDELLTGSSTGTGSPASVESGSMPSSFDVIAFSIPYENDYPNVVRFLSLAGIPTERARRSGRDPLVIAGGIAVTANPEPVADFLDAVVIGDGEGASHDIALLLFEAKQLREPKDSALREMAKVQGIYVPGLYTPVYSHDGIVESVQPAQADSTVVRRVDPHGAFAPARTVVFTDETEFSRMGLVEVGRGCPWGCSFCTASYNNSPARFIDKAAILDAAKEMSDQRDAMGLVGSAVSDHPRLEEMLGELLSMGLGFSVSSFRAGKCTPELLALLKQGGQRTITIAPEAGTESSREAIRKPLTDDALLEAALNVAAAGFRTLKLYFIVGLPGETMADVDGIVELVKGIRHTVQKSSLGKRDLLVSPSLASFVPKAQTPFQREPMMPPSELSKRLKRVKAGLRSVRGVTVHSDLPKWAYLQGVFSRGDRRCSRLVSALARSNFDWPRVGRETDVNPDFYAGRRRPDGEVLPWDHIQSGIRD